MLILALRTDKLESEIALFEGAKLLKEIRWKAHRQLAETLHSQIAELLQSADKDWHDLGGILVYRGPGSYTGLRIGISVANALAAGLEIPIVGTNGEAWRQSGIEKLLDRQNNKQILPEYGAPAYTTQPKK